MTEVTMDRYGYVMGTIPATPRMRERSGHRLHRPCGHLARHERQRRPATHHRGVRRRRHRPQRTAHDARRGVPRAGVLQGPHADPHRRHDAARGRRQGGRGGGHERRGIPHDASRGRTRQDPHRLHADEEVGRGVDHFDVAAFGADFAYTVDGGMEGELEYENFNAASARIDIQGRNVHPGLRQGEDDQRPRRGLRVADPAPGRTAAPVHRRIRGILPLRRRERHGRTGRGEATSSATTTPTGSKRRRCSSGAAWTC